MMQYLQWPLAVDLGLACANPRSNTANESYIVLMSLSGV